MKGWLTSRSLIVSVILVIAIVVGILYVGDRHARSKWRRDVSTFDTVCIRGFVYYRRSSNYDDVFIKLDEVGEPIDCTDEEFTESNH